jgi:hypothetical protein
LLGSCAQSQRLSEEVSAGPGIVLDGTRAQAARAKIERKRAKLEKEGLKRYDQPQEALEFFLEQRVSPDEPYPFEHVRAELERIRAREASAQPGPGSIQSWSELGPGNIGGRTRALAIDPHDPDVMYAGGVAGGIWKSTDGGGRWRPADDLMLNLAVTTIVIDPANTNVLYAGTGEGFFAAPSVRGLGIFKSVDAGVSWVQLAGTADPNVPIGAFYYVNDIVLSPNDSARVYAATRSGVWRSTDAGATWSVVLRNPNALASGGQPSNGSFLGASELAIRSDRNPDVLFAAMGGTFVDDGLWRSLDGGDTWTQLGTTADLVRPDQGRMALAIAPSNNDVMYVCMAKNQSSGELGTLLDVFRTNDGGNTWSGRVDFTSLTGPWLLSNLVFATGCAGTTNLAQGWYDNVIAVDPTNQEIVWVGGIDLFRSKNGARSFEIASYWYFPRDDPNFVHADQHALVFHPGYDGAANQVLYVGNDGGIFRTDNARHRTSLNDCPFGSGPHLPEVAWRCLNNAYGVTQFYHGDTAPLSQLFAGGTQDNGTLLARSETRPNAWEEIFGGDGGHFAFNPINPRVFYLETQRFPSMYKTVDGGESFEFAGAGIADSDGLFITPFAMDPSDPETLWTGGSRPWRTTDGAQSWQLAANADPTNPADDPFPGPSTISAVAIARSTSEVVYLGFSNGWIAKTTNARSSPPAWTLFDSSNGLQTNAFISSVAVHPSNPDIAYCTYSTFNVEHVFRTANGGMTWTSIDGLGFAGVPDIPVCWIEIRPCTPSELYVGTELGVFASSNEGATWAPANAGLAHTVIESLDFRDHDTLVAFSHGRGAFQAPLAPCFTGCAQPSTYCSGKTNSLGCVPFIDFFGTPSQSAAVPFVIRANDVLPSQEGALIYGTKAGNLDFHGGKLCVKLPFMRLLPPKQPDPFGAPSCEGTLWQDFNRRIQSGLDPVLTAGQRIHAQWRQRDPADPFGDGLTDAIEFTICP